MIVLNFASHTLMNVYLCIFQFIFIFVCYVEVCLFFFFFFFQAEDGIRYGTVTGVQTCALPICADLAAHEAAGAEGLARTCRDLLRTAGAPTRRRAGVVAPALRARGVTAREAEVLALVAAGLTNAEAAERLFLSRRTVETHVARLLAKTGAADRSQLRRWA